MTLVFNKSMLTGISNRFMFLNYLGVYYKSPEWKRKRKEKLDNVGWKSEVSGLDAEVIHHIIYPFKKLSDFEIRELWGTERDSQLMALTFKEHEIVHSYLQDVAHKPKMLLKELKEYFDI